LLGSFLLFSDFLLASCAASLWNLARCVWVSTILPFFFLWAPVFFLFCPGRLSLPRFFPFWCGSCLLPWIGGRPPSFSEVAGLRPPFPSSFGFSFPLFPFFHIPAGVPIFAITVQPSLFFFCLITRKPFGGMPALALFFSRLFFFVASFVHLSDQLHPKRPSQLPSLLPLQTCKVNPGPSFPLCLFVFAVTVPPTPVQGFCFFCFRPPVRPQIYFLQFCYCFYYWRLYTLFLTS